MKDIVIVGCGVVGAAIAYELSQFSNFNITVIDQQPPAQAATGAALGVLMGIISQKMKGRAWRLRQASMQRYESLIPELEALTSRIIPFNRQGILLLSYAEDEREKWQNLIQFRRSQGLELQWLEKTEVQSRYPQINSETIIGAVYSPQDRQVDPTALTLALVDAAQRRGVNFKFGVTVEQLEILLTSEQQRICQGVKTNLGALKADWVIMSAGLGTTPLIAEFFTENLQQKPIKIRPVLGQAVQLKCVQPLGNNNLEPVITGDDVHIVPLGNAEYWVGATVEFPDTEDHIIPDPERFNQVMKQAITICPNLATATPVKQWSGLRPRPDGISAPVIEKLPGFNNVLLATGHYRNGILLAPATALEIVEKLGIKN